MNRKQMIDILYWLEQCPCILKDFTHYKYSEEMVISISTELAPQLEDTNDELEG